MVGSVPFAPIPVVGDDGNTHLVCEPSLIYYTDGAVTVDDVAVQDSATGVVLLDLSGAALNPGSSRGRRPAILTSPRVGNWLSSP